MEANNDERWQRSGYAYGCRLASLGDEAPGSEPDKRSRLRIRKVVIKPPGTGSSPSCGCRSSKRLTARHQAHTTESRTDRGSRMRARAVAPRFDGADRKAPPADRPCGGRSRRKRRGRLRTSPDLRTADPLIDAVERLVEKSRRTRYETFETARLFEGCEPMILVDWIRFRLAPGTSEGRKGAFQRFAGCPPVFSGSLAVGVERTSAMPSVISLGRERPPVEDTEGMPRCGMDDRCRIAELERTATHAERLLHQAGGIAGMSRRGDDPRGHGQVPGFAIESVARTCKRPLAGVGT